MISVTALAPCCGFHQHIVGALVCCPCSTGTKSPSHLRHCPCCCLRIPLCIGYVIDVYLAHWYSSEVTVSRNILDPSKVHQKTSVRSRQIYHHTLTPSDTVWSRTVRPLV